MKWLRALFGRRVKPQLSEDEFKSYLVSLGIRIANPWRDGDWRCGACGQMQQGDSQQVWIEDGARRGDPMWSVVERHRRHKWNGSSRAWCVGCCRSFTPMTADEMVKADAAPHDPIPIIPIFVTGMTIDPVDVVDPGDSTE